MKKNLLPKTRLFSFIVAAKTLSLLVTVSHAQAIEGITFSHNDWELACDNTGTCRAAGYSQEDISDDSGSYPLDMFGSVLLTRAAGPDQTISGQFSFRNDDDNELSSSRTVRLTIGNQEYGQIEYKDTPVALTKKQVQALLDAAKTDQIISFIDGDKQGIISNQGMSAVFLKMDDFQKRIDTTGAIIRKGNKPETSVLQPQPKPTLVIPKTLESDETLKNDYLNKREKIMGLTQADYKENCSIDDQEEQDLDIYPLNNQQALISRLCWRAAYNSGTAFWVVDKNLNSAKFITSDATDYENGEIGSGQKGRGIGDCWQFETYSWNGKEFIASGKTNTGMCKGQPGSYWDLPTLVYDVTKEQ